MRDCLRLSLTEIRTFPWSFQVSFHINSKSCWSFLVLMVNILPSVQTHFLTHTALLESCHQLWSRLQCCISTFFYLDYTMVISRKDVIMQILSIPTLCRKNREKDVAVLDSLLTFVQKLMQRSLYWPYLYTLSQSLLLHKKSLAFKHVFSNLQAPIQHAYGDCHLQSAHSAL